MIKLNVQHGSRRDNVWATVFAKACMRAINDHLCQSDGLLPHKLSVGLPKRATMLVIPTLHDDSLEITAFYRPRSEEFTEHMWRLRQSRLEAEWRHLCDAHIAMIAYPTGDLDFDFADATPEAKREIVTDVAFWNRVLSSARAA